MKYARGKDRMNERKNGEREDGLEKTRLTEATGRNWKE